MPRSLLKRNTPPSRAPENLLGGIGAQQFLARYWQKRPLLVRNAWPALRDPASPRDLLRLARRDDCEARLVVRNGKRWTLQHGPFQAQDLASLPARDWTVLVQGVNHFAPAADALMRAFDFIPYVRLDDVMASYAAPGGGVGPHFDSYDVFLIQGRGRRRWRISRQRDLALDPRAPLKIVTDFRPTQEWILEPGDMLYLPPGIAHEGVALESCITYSIGFRAPSERELGTEFLAFLQDRLPWRERLYADRDLRPAARPGEIDNDFVARCARMMKSVRWTRSDLEAFLGTYLSEPKQHVRFESPAPLRATAFEHRMRRTGVRLVLAANMLYRRGHFYVNGEDAPASGATRRLLERLADQRALAPGTSFTRAAVRLLYTWYRAGYLVLGNADE